MMRRAHLRMLAIASAAAILPSAALAQQPDVSGAQTGAASGNAAGGATSGTVVTAPVYGGIVAPPPPGQPLGGGNATESSSRTRTGDEEDSFDLGQSGAGRGTVYGGSNGGAVFFDQNGTPVQRVGPPPTTHVVKKGDTLWGICDEYFRNPYQWPRIWSYNPQIQNPHWIYPNDQVRLKPANGAGGAASGPQVAMPMQEGGVPTNARGAIVPDTVFLRDQGFVNDDDTLDWGAIVGSPQDKMFLSDTDSAYVKVEPNHDVKVGTELTVFRPIRKVNDGQVIAIQGTLRVDNWNPETRIARAQVVETLDAIERGARIGPLPRRFEVVAPKKNTADVEAHVAVAVHPHVFYGQQQIVFIDKGAEAGLQSGNRLFIVRRGDQWRATMYSDTAARRIATEREEPGVIEPTPKMKDDQSLPEEIVGELRVLAVQKKSATCLVTQSRYEIEPKDLAVARKGY